MAVINITRFRALVIISIALSYSAIGAETAAQPAPFRFFASAGSAVQTTKIGSAPALPQLRRSAELGLSALPNSRLRLALALGAFLVDPAVPSGKILYRGYSGFFAKGAVDWDFSAGNERSVYLFLSLGATAALARYDLTDLAFIEYSPFAAPGIANERAGFVFRVSVPIELNLKGDAASFSVGLLFSLSRARTLPQRIAE